MVTHPMAFALQQHVQMVQEHSLKVHGIVKYMTCIDWRGIERRIAAWTRRLLGRGQQFAGCEGRGG